MLLIYNIKPRKTNPYRKAMEKNTHRNTRDKSKWYSTDCSSIKQWGIKKETEKQTKPRGIKQKTKTKMTDVSHKILKKFSTVNCQHTPG